MNTLWRIIAIIAIFVGACIGWAILGAVTSSRTHEQSGRLDGEVVNLWGQPQRQAAPEFTLHWKTPREVKRTEEEKGKTRVVREIAWDEHERAIVLDSTRLAATVHLDQRLKGLLWYPLYDVVFDGAWNYRHEGTETGTLLIVFRFPEADALYDDFRFVINGADLAHGLRPVQGTITQEIPIANNQEVSLAVHYKARGMREWRYVPSQSGVSSLHDFRLDLTCDFLAIDFPQGTLSPSTRTEQPNGGWRLSWQFAQVLTGQGMGLVMPEHVQPGELALAMTATAPISLFFFFLILFALSVLRSLDVHPINYLAIAGAFFSFQLLFSYMVDHTNIGAAFAIASLASTIMVTMYLRLVVSARFAFREAAIAQILYQVGFAAAHFLKGYTGLTVSILATVTLFVLMLLTGRVRWSTSLSRTRH